MHTKGLLTWLPGNGLPPAGVLREGTTLSETLLADRQHILRTQAGNPQTWGGMLLFRVIHVFISIPFMKAFRCIF
jgi:hypothetical protein